MKEEIEWGGRGNKRHFSLLFHDWFSLLGGRGQVGEEEEEEQRREHRKWELMETS